ncbi:hypothetical protein [Nostoc sp. C110]|jgi:hypothetical protein|uniref:hypothetical protein n=1 Tax=Nostoc sp. C110 TaxID=3349876 RepID=UPI00370D840C
MKAIQGSSKLQLPQPKSNNSSQKPKLVAYRPVEQPSVTLQAAPTPSDESPSVEQQAQTVPSFTSKRNVSEKPQHLEKGKVKRISPDKKKSNSLQQPQFTLRDNQEELLSKH